MKYLFAAIYGFCFSGILFSQCSSFPATIAEGNCATVPGTTPLTSGANINSGNYIYCNSSSTDVSFSSINLSGGNIYVCGNMTITGGNWNSGNIIVACGSTLTFSSSLTLNNNIKIINYGRVNINGNFEFQNNNNCFYNETQNASLYVTGNFTFQQNNSDQSYLKNNGYVSIGGLLNARNGTWVCSGAGSIMQVGSFSYGTDCNGSGPPANRFFYDGSTGTSVFRINGACTLRNSVTSSSNYRVNLGISPLAVTYVICSVSVFGTWGSAIVAQNSPSFTIPSSPGPCPTNSAGCFTALPIGLVSFEAIEKNEKVELYWTTESEQNNNYFTVQRSSDGTNWEDLSKVNSQGNGNKLRNYLQTDDFPLRGTSYYRLAQTDFDGTMTFSEIRSVVVRPTETFVMYPNPATDYFTLLPAENISLVSVSIMDATGRVVSNELINQNPSKGQPFTFQVSGFGKGIYSVLVVLSNGVSELRQLIIT